MTDEVTFNACYAVADDGTLAYVAGPSFSEESRLGWLDVMPRPRRSRADDAPRSTTTGSRSSTRASRPTASG